VLASVVAPAVDSTATGTVTRPQGRGSTHLWPRISRRTRTAWAQDCAQSRMWAGVHFRAAVTAGAALGTQIGDSVYTFVDQHIRGAVGPLP